MPGLCHQSMIKDLYHYSDDWKVTTVDQIKDLERQNPGALVRHGGDYGYRPIYYAVFHGASNDVIDYMLKEMVDTHGFPEKYLQGVKAYPYNMIYSLYEHTFSWRYTSISHVKLLVHSDPEVLRRKNMFGTIPIYHAVTQGAKLEVVMWLCENTGLDIVNDWRSDEVSDVRGNTGATLLHIAAWRNYAYLIPYLLEVTPDGQNVRSHPLGLTPLGWAQKWQYTECADLLIDPDETVRQWKVDPKKAIKEYTMVYEVSALHESSNKWKNTSLGQVQRLERIGATCPQCNDKDFLRFGDDIRCSRCKYEGPPTCSLQVLDGEGNLPIVYAVVQGAKLEVVQWMCEKSGDRFVVEWRGNIGETVFHYAALEQPHLVPYFLMVFGLPSLTLIDDKYDKSVIDWAEHGGNNSCIRYVKNPEQTIEDYVVQREKEQKERIQILAERRRVGICDDDDVHTIVSLHDYSEHWARTKLDIIEDLYKQNPSVLLELDEYGLLPVVYAAWKGAKLDVFSWMCKHTGIDVVKKWRDSPGWCIFHYAAAFNQSHLLPYLMSVFPEGADVVEDMYGGNALYWANKRGHEMCAKILIGKNAGAGSGSDSNSSDEQEHLNDEEASKTPTLNSRGMGRSLFAHKYRRSSPQFHETT